MSSIGDLGVPKPEAEALTFGWFGTELRVHPELSELVLMDFMEAAQSVDESSPTAMTLLKDTLRMAIHPDDFKTFWELALKNRQGAEDLMKAFQSIIAGATDRPMVQLTDSSDGLPQTVATLRDVSSWVAEAEEAPQDMPVSPLSEMDIRVIKRLGNRPDLMQAVEQVAAGRTQEATG